VLEVVGAPIDDALLSGWRARVERTRAMLGWQTPGLVARRHARGTSLALAAPCDQLFLATSINEWALCATLFAHDPHRWRALPEVYIAAALEDEQEPAVAPPPSLEESAALTRFERLAALEARPDLKALLGAAAVRNLPYMHDDAKLTLGSGSGGRSYLLTDLPATNAVPWQELHDIPTAIVTGSNGKTTTVRLLAACTRLHGWRTGYNCTDGVFVDDEIQVSGDYSGPAGARWVLREPRVDAAILETARGGILRRGVAMSRAQVAIVTNISTDHFGEYGIYDLDALADVKLSVASVVVQDGLLVINADDDRLLAKAADLASRFGGLPPLGLFALDADHPTLREYRRHGAATCGVRDGRLRLENRGVEHDLGAVAAMPLTVDGSAIYNIANLAAAALGAVALGVQPRTIATAFAGFGARPADNPGRMMRFEVGGVLVLVDYAHNPDGLRGLLEVAGHLRVGAGRLGLLLGHAGNRQDADIDELARVAAEFSPDLIVVKENEAQLRGRALGEMPRMIRAALLRSGFPEAALLMAESEVAAAHCALDWARPGDVLAMPVHSLQARSSVLSLLGRKGQEAPPTSDRKS
jgi:cyanophycin synthetase